VGNLLQVIDYDYGQCSFAGLQLQPSSFSIASNSVINRPPGGVWNRPPLPPDSFGFTSITSPESAAKLGHCRIAARYAIDAIDHPHRRGNRSLLQLQPKLLLDPVSRVRSWEWDEQRRKSKIEVPRAIQAGLFQYRIRA